MSVKKKKIEQIKDICTGCMACVSKCPVKCISCELDEEGFYYPRIDHDKCIDCDKCQRVCHVMNFNSNFPDDQRHTFYGRSEKRDVLSKSTSGGAFYHLARAVLDCGGTVYAAHFDLKDRILKHSSTDMVDLESLLKSKYVESKMGETVSNIQEDICAGRQVLFCGTPCQVSGVKNAINDENDLLTTVDFICHGVPSTKILQEHLSNLVRDAELVEIDFRPKASGWSSINLSVKTEKKSTYIPYYIDAYYAGFMKNVFLRRSCYDCQFRTEHRSDITIADFWGYRAVDPLMDVKDGMSLIITHTDRGVAAVTNLKDFELHEIDNKFSDYALGERRYPLSPRKEFYDLYNKRNFKYAARKTYMKGSWKAKIKYRIKKVLGRG